MEIIEDLPHQIPLNSVAFFGVVYYVSGRILVTVICAIPAPAPVGKQSIHAKDATTDFF